MDGLWWTKASVVIALVAAIIAILIWKASSSRSVGAALLYVFLPLLSVVAILLGHDLVSTARQPVPAVPATLNAAIPPEVPTGAAQPPPVNSAPPHVKSASPVPAPLFEALNPAAFAPGSPAVLLVEGNHHARELSAQLASALTGTDALFTVDFLESAALARLRDGDLSMLRDADLARATSMLVVGSISRVTRRDEVAGETVFRTTASLTGRIHRPRGSPRTETFVQSGIGSGFDERTSVVAADASLIRQVAAQLLGHTPEP